MILAASILALYAILAGDADKHSAADRLRDVVRGGGCADIAVEMVPTRPDEPLQMIARCRDEAPPKEKD